MSAAPIAENCRAMVLAAGYGTRLEPLTASRAKVVVPFLNRPLLDYTLDWLRRCGFGEVVVNLHHKPASVRRLYGDCSFDLDIRYSVEDSLLGTAGGPRAVLDELGDRVLIVNGDIATTMSPGPLWQHHAAADALATMALYAGEGAEEYPTVDIDDTGRVTRIPGVGPNGGAPPDATFTVGCGGCFTGVHIIEREVLELVPEKRFCGLVEPIYGSLLEHRLPLHGLVVPGSWYEIGTVPRYVSCQLQALRREEFPLAFEGYRRETAGGFVARSVYWRRAGMRAPYMLGTEVRLEEASLIEGVIAGPRVHVGRGATVRDSVLLEGAWVGSGARVERSVVLEGAIVPPGAEVRDQAVVGGAAGVGR